MTENGVFTNPWPLVFAIAGLGILAALSLAVYFGYFYRTFPRDFQCEDIPKGSVVVALGFEYPGEDDLGIVPGDANKFLANLLGSCAPRISLVLTQKAVSDALLFENLLIVGKLKGTAGVILMHDHNPRRAVRTFQALQRGLEKLRKQPEALVLLAHDKQVSRAKADLEILFPGKIIVWQVNKVPYKDGQWFRPLLWALRELYIARPAEAFTRWTIARFSGRRDEAGRPIPRSCDHCEHYLAGEVDAQINWVECGKGHRLIATAEKNILHQPNGGEPIQVTADGWSGGEGFGEPMLERTDCPDWKRRGFRLEIQDMEN